MKCQAWKASALNLCHAAMQEATGGKTLQQAVLPVHDVPLEELTRKLRTAWASCGGTPDPAAVKQVHLSK